MTGTVMIENIKPKIVKDKIGREYPIYRGMDRTTFNKLRYCLYRKKKLKRWTN